MTNNNKLSALAQAAQDKARSDNGTFGAQIPTPHEDVVAARLTPARPAVYAEDGVFFITLPDGRDAVYGGARGTRLPHEDINPSATILDDGTIRLVWAMQDVDDQPYGWPAGQEFEEFRSEGSRDQFIARRIEQGVPKENIFIIDKNDRGTSVGYGVAAGNPERSFNITPSGVLILDARGDMGLTISAEAANTAVDDFASHSNGDIYGISSVLLDADGYAIPQSGAESWNFIGTANTQRKVDAGEVF